MKVILIQDVPKIGRKGEIKEVSSGYASNFLIPKKMAQIATAELQTKLNKEQKEQNQKMAKEQNRLKLLQADLEKQTFIIQVKTGDKGQIFGAVHEKEIAAAITHKLNKQFDKSQIELNAPLKIMGQHIVTMKLGQGLKAKIKLNISPLN